MTYRLKLELTGRQVDRLYSLLAFPLTRTDERHPDVKPAVYRLREALMPWGQSAYLHPDGIDVLKLDISAYDEAVLALVLTDSLAEQIEQHRTITHPFVADILAIQSALAGYVQAREAARLVSGC